MSKIAHPRLSHDLTLRNASLVTIVSSPIIFVNTGAGSEAELKTPILDPLWSGNPVGRGHTPAKEKSFAHIDNDSVVSSRASELKKCRRPTHVHTC